MFYSRVVVVFLFYNSILRHHTTQGIVFKTVPRDACANSGDVVDFNCSASLIIQSMVVSAAQLWTITPLSGSAITLRSAVDDSKATPGFSFIRSPNLSGIAVTVSLNLTNATLQCSVLGMAMPVGEESILNTSQVAILQVADKPSQFSCSLESCPHVYTFGGDNTCTVQWSAPWTAECAPLTSYNVTLTRTDGEEVVSSSSQSPMDAHMHDIIVPEPAVSYMVTITASNRVGTNNCVIQFTSPRELRPNDFTFNVTITSMDQATVVPISSGSSPQPSVTKYIVTVRDQQQQVLTMQTFPGHSSSLSLNINSLPQCMSYTVSVTASNTGGSTTAEAELNLDPLASLEVSCVAGEDGCYLEASCVPSQPGLVNGCRLDYSSNGGSTLTTSIGLSVSSSRTAVVPCDNQTISYNGTAYDLMSTALRCPRSGTTKCLLVRYCPALSAVNATVQYDTDPPASASSASASFGSGTVATYSCADGYQLVERRTCLVDGLWSESEPHCTGPNGNQDSSNPSISYAWFPLSIFLLVYSLLSTILIVSLTLTLCCRTHQKGCYKVVSSDSTQQAVDLKENLCYGPVTSFSSPPASPSGFTQETVALQENLCYNPVTLPPPHTPPAVTTTTAAAAEVSTEYEEIGASSSRPTQTKES